MGYRWTTPPERDTALRLANRMAPTSRRWAALGVIAVVILIGLCW